MALQRKLLIGLKLKLRYDKMNKVACQFVKEGLRLSDKKNKLPIEHFNIGEFNRGQSSKLIKGLITEDKTAFIQKNGKPIAVVMSYERYERMFEKGIDINDY